MATLQNLAKYAQTAQAAKAVGLSPGVDNSDLYARDADMTVYPFQKYGMLDGKVETVIADASADGRRSGNGGSGGATSTAAAGAAPDTSSYRAIIRLASQELRANTLKLPLAAGMQLSAEIVEDQRTVMEYLLSPVQRIAGEAGRER